MTELMRLESSRTPIEEPVSRVKITRSRCPRTPPAPQATQVGFSTTTVTQLSILEFRVVGPLRVDVPENMLVCCELALCFQDSLLCRDASNTGIPVSEALILQLHQ